MSETSRLSWPEGLLTAARAKRCVTHHFACDCREYRFLLLSNGADNAREDLARVTTERDDLRNDLEIVRGCMELWQERHAAMSRMYDEMKRERDAARAAAEGNERLVELAARWLETWKANLGAYHRCSPDELDGLANNLAQAREAFAAALAAGPDTESAEVGSAKEGNDAPT